VVVGGDGCTADGGYPAVGIIVPVLLRPIVVTGQAIPRVIPEGLAALSAPVAVVVMTEHGRVDLRWNMGSVGIVRNQLAVFVLDVSELVVVCGLQPQCCTASTGKTARTIITVGRRITHVVHDPQWAGIVKLGQKTIGRVSGILIIQMGSA